MIRVLAMSALLAMSAQAAAPPLPGDSAYQFDASLTDQSGKALRFHDLRGRPRLVTMFYANCPFVCPLIVDSVKAIERELTPGERQRIGFILISLDPARDSPAALQGVMTSRRLDAGRWQLLRPDEKDLRGLAGVLGIRYRALADGEFNHSTSLVLLDAEGRIVARSDRIGGKPEPEFMAAVRGVLAKPGN